MLALLSVITVRWNFLRNFTSEILGAFKDLGVQCASVVRVSKTIIEAALKFNLQSLMAHTFHHLQKKAFLMNWCKQKSSWRDLLRNELLFGLPWWIYLEIELKCILTWSTLAKMLDCDGVNIMLIWSIMGKVLKCIITDMVMWSSKTHSKEKTRRELISLKMFTLKASNTFLH